MPKPQRRENKGLPMTQIGSAIKMDHLFTSPLLSVAETANYLGMSRDWVYERLKALVPHVKIGGALKFRREDLERYIASRTVTPMNTQDIRSPHLLRELMHGQRSRNGHKNR